MTLIRSAYLSKWIPGGLALEWKSLGHLESVDQVSIWTSFLCDEIEPFTNVFCSNWHQLKSAVWNCVIAHETNGFQAWAALGCMLLLRAHGAEVHAWLPSQYAHTISFYQDMLDADVDVTIMDSVPVFVQKEPEPTSTIVVESIDEQRRFYESINGVFAYPQGEQKGLVCWSGRANSVDESMEIKKRFHVFTMDHFYPSDPGDFWKVEHREDILDWAITIDERVLAITKHPKPLLGINFYPSRLAHAAYRPIAPRTIKYDLLLAHRIDPVKNWEMIIQEGHTLKGLRVIVLVQPAWSYAYSSSTQASLIEMCRCNGFEFGQDWLDHHEMNRLYNQTKCVVVFSHTEGDSRVTHEAIMSGTRVALWSKTKTLIDYTAASDLVMRFDNLSDLAVKTIAMDDEPINPSLAFTMMHNYEVSNQLLRCIATQMCGPLPNWISRDALGAFYHRQMENETRLLQAQPPIA